MNYLNGYVSNLQETGVVNISSIIIFEKNYSFLKSLDKNSKILEIGSGNGFFVDWLLLLGFHDISIVDIDEENIDSLRVKYQNFSSVKLYCESITNFFDKHSEEKYDLIVSRQLIEHLHHEELLSFIDTSSHRLTSQGMHIHETINAQNFVYGSYYRYIDFSHFNSFTPKSIKEYFGICFEKINVKNYLQPGPLYLLYYYLFTRRNDKIASFFGKKDTGEQDNGSSTFQSFSFLLKGFLLFTFSFFQYYFAKSFSRIFSNGSQASITSHFLIVIATNKDD